MIDYHIHSKFSADSSEDLDAIFTRACDLGLSSIAITDHLDPFPDPDRNLFTFDKDAYFASLPPLPGKISSTGHPNRGRTGHDPPNGGQEPEGNGQVPL